MQVRMSCSGRSDGSAWSGSLLAISGRPAASAMAPSSASRRRSSPRRGMVAPSQAAGAASASRISAPGTAAWSGPASGSATDRRSRPADPKPRWHAPCASAGCRASATDRAAPSQPGSRDARRCQAFRRQRPAAPGDQPKPCARSCSSLRRASSSGPPGVTSVSPGPDPRAPLQGGRDTARAQGAQEPTARAPPRDAVAVGDAKADWSSIRLVSTIRSAGEAPQERNSSRRQARRKPVQAFCRPGPAGGAKD